MTTGAGGSFEAKKSGGGRTSERKVRRVAVPTATRAGSPAIVSIGLLEIKSVYTKCQRVGIQ